MNAYEIQVLQNHVSIIEKELNILKSQLDSLLTTSDCTHTSTLIDKDCTSNYDFITITD